MKATYSLRKPRSGVKHTIMLTIYHQGERILRRSSGIQIRPDLWDEDQIIIHPKRRELNERLDWFRNKHLQEMKDLYEKKDFNDYFIWAKHHIQKYTYGKTNEMYTNKVRYFKDWLHQYEKMETIGFDFLSRELIQRYRRFLEDKGHTQNTVSAYMRPLRTIALRAEAEGVIEKTISWKFLIPTTMTTINDSLNVVIPMEDFHLIYQYEPEDIRRKTYRALALTQYLLRGMDYVDVILLRREYWKGDHLLFPGRSKLESRKRQPAKFYVPETIREIFSDISNHPGEYLFPVLGLMTQKPKGDDFRKYYSKWLKQFGLNGCKHIRHNFATHLYQLGASGDMVSYALLHVGETGIGNKSMRIAYIKMQDDVLSQYIEKMEKVVILGTSI